jgi:DNA-binding transcriptional regulator YiaG
MREWTPNDIKQFREAYHITAQAMADMLGVTISTIFKWQEGVRRPSKSAQLLLERIEEELKKKGGKKHGKG